MFFSKLLIIVFATAMVFAENLPTIHQVYQTAKSGDLNGAHQMVEQVLQAHPESAKAHFVDAEILVRQGNVSDAKNELAKAEQLAPGLPFAKPQSVQNLKQHLQSPSTSSLNSSIVEANQINNHSIPWMMIIMALCAVLLIWLAIRAFASRNTNGYPAQYNGGNPTSGVNPNNPNGPSGFGGGQPYPQQGSGLGGGIMSGLATGAAAGAGFVAGEALMHHFMDEPSTSTHDNTNNAPIVNNEPTNDMGGNDFGVNDNSSWDDSSSETLSDSSDDSW